MYNSKFFKQREFACKCGCGYGLKDGDVSEELLQKLDQAREEAGVPFVIRSGCRCAKHNSSDRVKGAKESAHLTGMAADIAVNDRNKAIIEAVLRKHFVRIGIGAKNFIHVDVDHQKAHQGEFRYA